MDLRIHFERPASPIELEIENNSLCILSLLGKTLKDLRLPENGRWLNIRVNSKTYLRPIKGAAGMPAQYGSNIDVESYRALCIEDRKKFLLNWLTETFETAFDFFLKDGLDQKTKDAINQFRNQCSFKALFTGKWTQVGDQRARVVVYQRFQQADIHIESKKYRARTSHISPILAKTAPSVFIFQSYLKAPRLENGEWHLTKAVTST